jgi:colanic acid biosynthesis protein WcaH
MFARSSALQNAAPIPDSLSAVSLVSFCSMNDQEFLRIVDATPLVSIDLIIRNEYGQALLGKRLNRPARDSWFVPGGRIRKNETVPQALARISRRELGVTITDAKLIGVFDHLYNDNFLAAPGVSTHYVVLGFAAQLPAAAALIPDDQHSELCWCGIEELLARTDVHENTKAYFR